MLHLTALLCVLLLTPPPVPGGAPFKPPLAPRNPPGTRPGTPPLGPAGKQPPATPTTPSQPAAPKTPAPAKTADTQPSQPSQPAEEAKSPVATVAETDLVLLDTKLLVPKLDAMHDVQPLSGVIGRCPASVTTAVPALPDQSGVLSWQADPDQVKLMARNAAGQSSVLCVLRWKGASLEWSWSRCSQSSFTQAVADAERMLRWMTIQITLEGGKHKLGTAAAQRVVRTLPGYGESAIMQLPPVRGLVVVPDASGVWTITPAGGGQTIHLESAAGSLDIRVDTQQRRLVADFSGGGGSVTVAELKQTIAERNKELQRATPDEKLLIEAEIQKLKNDLATAEAEARKHAPWAPLPVLRLQDEVGRVVAVLELQVKQS